MTHTLRKYSSYRTPLNSQPWVPPQVPSLYTALTTGSMDPATYGPGINPWVVKSGQIVQIHMRNPHMYPHPMHLHGHTFALAGQAGPGIRKDTINVLPMETLAVDFQADNPGQWLVHCHNIYHGELGMMTVVSYRA